MGAIFGVQRTGGAAVFGVQLGALATNIIPAAAALVLTGFAPTVAQSANQAVTPGAASLTITGFAPTVSQSNAQTVTPGPALVAITGYAPTVDQAAGQAVYPGAAVFSISGFTPSVAQTGSVSITPGAAFLSVVGFAPTVSRSGQSLRQRLYAALDPLAVGGAWFQINTAEPPTYPFIVFTRVVSPQNVNLNGASDLQNTRVQVDLFVRDDSLLETLEDAIDAAIATAFPQSLPISTQDLYEDAAKAYRSLREYSIWGVF